MNDLIYQHIQSVLFFWAAFNQFSWKLEMFSNMEAKLWPCLSCFYRSKLCLGEQCVIPLRGTDSLNWFKCSDRVFGSQTLFHSQFRPLPHSRYYLYPTPFQIHFKTHPSPIHTRNVVEVTERLALPPSDHETTGSNPAAGEILSEPKRRFIAHSRSCSPFHPSEMIEILLKET